MTNQFLETYNEIESQRKLLKEHYNRLVESNADEDILKETSKKITELTFKEADILVCLQKKA